MAALRTAVSGKKTHNIHNTSDAGSAALDEQFLCPQVLVATPIPDQSLPGGFSSRCLKLNRLI